MNAIVLDSQSSAPPCRATTDDQLIVLWLHGKSPNTQRAYLHDVKAFFDATGKGIRTAAFDDLVYYIESLQFSDHAKYRTTMAIKSLFTFAANFRYTSYNLGSLIKAKTPKNVMVERILTTNQVLSMIKTEPNKRNRAILQVLYKGGLRVSELCKLKWRDVTVSGDECFLNVYGKGDVTRNVGLPAGATKELMALRNPGLEYPVFRSRNKGGHLDQSMIHRIVRKAARRIGLQTNVSPHWLRHSCGTDLVEAGCSLSMVKAHLGHSDLKTTQQYLHIRPDSNAGRFLE